MIPAAFPATAVPAMPAASDAFALGTQSAANIQKAGADVVTPGGSLTTGYEAQAARAQPGPDFSLLLDVAKSFMPNVAPGRLNGLQGGGLKQPRADQDPA